MNTSLETLYLISKLLAFTVLLQSFEYLKICKSFSEQGIWRWSELRVEYAFLPKPLRSLLDLIMTDKAFLNIIRLRFFLSSIILFHPTFYLILYLLLSTWVICLRWRGSFNGGSDYLTLIGLLCVSIGLIKPASVILTKGVLWYLSLQVISSYFISGIYKLKQKKWWNGIALKGFLASPEYSVPQFVLVLINNINFIQIISIAVIIFEITFPLAIFSKLICIAFLIIGALFHFTNFWIFGLNRFFWTWLSTYPAIYYCSKSFNF